jgi:hypothetical protein
MSASLPNGSLLYIGTPGTATATTILTNANPCVVTSTAHGLANGDEVVITSGWSRINGKVFRVANITANTFELEGLDTTNTTVYAAGSGVGTFSKVTAWTQITQILSTSSTGGEQRFVAYQYLESDIEVEIPTVKSGGGINIEIADDPSLAGQQALEEANDDRDPRPLRVVKPNSGKIYYYGYVSVNKTPTLTVNEISRVAGSVRFINEPVRYSS